MHTTEVEAEEPQLVQEGIAPSETKRVAVGRLETPPETQPIRIRWAYAIGIGVIHLLALLALVPWLFSWSGVAVAVLAHYFIGTWGICLGYHRLLTHRGFCCPRWFEKLLALLGVCCLEDTPARWVAIHRMHHQHSDERPDPHTPFVNFIWGHVGWLLVKNREHHDVMSYERYARDLLREPFYMLFERRLFWVATYVLHAIPFFIGGLMVGWIGTGDYWLGVQLGLSWLVWGVFVRTVTVWHAAWSVNSLAHIWGYRNYDTADNSRNNWFVAILATGEGWHNNHHADQRAAAHGHKWWEFDVTWLTILLMEKVGLVKDVVRPKVWSESSAS